MRFTKMVVAAVSAVSLLLISPALGVPGREKGSPKFSISFMGSAPEGRFEDRLQFDPALGWDFGDRAAYACAWAEYFDTKGSELFELHFEVVKGYKFPLGITDRNGAEAPNKLIEPLCGDGSGPGASVEWDGSDHFPHGATFSVHDRGKQVAGVDLHRADCSKTYWTPGDEAGEAWLWWDGDGPRSNGHHDLDCGGGPQPPAPIGRAYVKNAGPGVTYCVEDSLDGDICS